MDDSAGHINPKPAAPPNPMKRPFFSAAETDRKNMLRLIQLRWLGVLGQVIAIAVVYGFFSIPLPLEPMLTTLLIISAVNCVSHLILPYRKVFARLEVMLGLIFDITALTVQLYFCGGAANPFVFLLLIQVALGAILLDKYKTWGVVAYAVSCFLFLTIRYWPLSLPPESQVDEFILYLQGSAICFFLIAILLTFFVTRIAGNMRELDHSLAVMRQNAAEEDLVVRMGLLASGAAHELGTPLSSLSVILSDWQRIPELSGKPELLQDIQEMQAEVKRCKSIVTGILQSAGEMRSEAPSVTTIKSFLEKLASDWRDVHHDVNFTHENLCNTDAAIIVDPVIEKVIFNVLDNAAEASPQAVTLTSRFEEDVLILDVTDAGPGFDPVILTDFGKPYRTTKGRPGGGLGLFLVVNFMRKLGGAASATNLAGKGAQVRLSFPLSALAAGGGYVS